MLSALLMLKRLRSALSYARREEYWDRVAGAGVLLAARDVADPDLVIEDHWIKLFTVF